MTERFLGSIITSTPVEPSANVENSSASGVWNIHDPLIFGQAEDWPDPTVASPDKFVENLFSCFTYTGTGSTLTINNGIDFSGSGGLLWIKNRENVGGYAQDHSLIDTERGHTVALKSNSTSGNTTQEYALGTNGSFNSNGFTQASTNNQVNASGTPYISWSFRKQPKFFDVVTYTGNGSAGRTVSHSLGSVPGMIIIKKTNAAKDWAVYHRGKGKAFYGLLNTTAAFVDDAGDARWHDTDPTATEFTLGNDSEVNANSDTYVAYLFAHNDGDGGFGSTGDQDIIKCGSYTGTGDTDGPSIDLGFEPQFVMVKNASTSSDWMVVDSIRGITTRSGAGTGDDRILNWNTTGAESASGGLDLNPDGFKLNGGLTASNGNGNTHIYMAIRRGPMQTPTAATSVFDVQKYTGNNTTHRKFTTNFVVDANITSGFTINHRTCWGARLLDGMHETSQTAVSYYNLTDWIDYDHNDGYDLPAVYTYSNISSGSPEYVSYSFSRAPKFFDVVTYAGTGSATTVKHNLEVTPELMIIKNIASVAEWTVYSRNDATDHLHLNAGDVTSDEDRFFNDTAPTSSVFTVGDRAEVNASSNSYVAYLFATLAGISKIGTYSGTGNDVNVDCGFTSGARFVLVKRADSSGDWYHWDSVNGIVAGNDPYLLFNSDAAQVTNTDYIDPLSSGFTITSGAPSDLNTNGGTYLFLAIA